MKHLFLFFTILFVLLTGCQNKQHEIIIEGTLKNAEGKMLRLVLLDLDDAILLDSVKIKEGHYKFSLNADSDIEKTRFSTPMLYQITLAQDNTMTTLAQGGDHLTIDADGNDLIGSYRVRGSEEAVLVGQLDSALASFVKTTDQLFDYYQKNIEIDSLREKIEQQYVILLQNHKEFLSHFIQKNPDKMASFIAFYQSYNRRSFFDEKTDLDLLKTITKSLHCKYPNNPYIKNMVQHVEVLDLVRQQEKQTEK